MTSAGHHSMMEARGVALPYDHAVEYLESTGTQWIDTGKHGNQGMSAELKAALMKQTVDQSIFSADNGNSYASAFSLNTWTTLRFIRNDATSETFQYSATVAYHFKCSHSGLVVDGTTYPIRDDGISFETIGTIPLCAWNRNGSIIVKSSCRIYFAKFYQGETIVFDGIPVRKDGVGEMYDRVSGTFATRYGTFVIGPDTSAASKGGYKRPCVKRSHRRSSRPSARFWRQDGWRAAHSPRTWEVAA